MPTGAVNHTFTAGAAGGSSPIGPLQFTSNGDIGSDINVGVPASTTDQLFTIAIDHTKVKSLILVPTVDMTIRVNANSGGSPAFTWNGKANTPVVLWTSLMGVAYPLSTTDVTALYLSVAGLVDGSLTGLVNQLT